MHSGVGARFEKKLKSPRALGIFILLGVAMVTNEITLNLTVTSKLHTPNQYYSFWLGLHLNSPSIVNVTRMYLPIGFDYFGDLFAAKWKDLINLDRSFCTMLPQVTNVISFVVSKKSNVTQHSQTQVLSVLSGRGAFGVSAHFCFAPIDRLFVLGIK